MSGSTPNPRLPAIPQPTMDPASVPAVLNAMRQRIEALTGFVVGLQTMAATLAATVGAAAASASTGAPATTEASPYVPMTAAATVNAHRALMFDGAGNVLHANPNSPNYAFAGISTQSATTGATLLVAEEDLVSEGSWSWTPGTALFAGPDGTLVTTAPAAGVVQQVAVAATPTSILVQPFPVLVRH